MSRVELFDFFGCLLELLEFFGGCFCSMRFWLFFLVPCLFEGKTTIYLLCGLI